MTTIGDAKFELRMKPEAKAEVLAAIFKATQETFELDIKPEAQENSPVSAEWPSIPESRGEGRHDTGHNRRSIDVEVVQGEHGPEASLFTQSGYGGYLEIGTYKMPARPYLWPAFQKHVQTLVVRIRAILAGGQ